jgi:hypothetical protein
MLGWTTYLVPETAIACINRTSELFCPRVVCSLYGGEAGLTPLSRAICEFRFIRATRSYIAILSSELRVDVDQISLGFITEG